MRRRAIRIPAALAWSALTGGGLAVVVSCSSGAEPTPSCSEPCADAAFDHLVVDAPSMPDSAMTLDSPPAPDAPASPDGPVDAIDREQLLG